jgi:hypothetical protein
VSAAAVPLHELDAAGRGLWAEVEAAWDDQGRHDRFVRHCAAAGLLPAAGRQYRLHLDDHAGDPIATRMQQRIVVMATQLLAMHRQPPAPITRSPWFTIFLVVAALAGIVAAVLYTR